MASALVEEFTTTKQDKHIVTGLKVDEEYLAQMGVLSQLPAWRAMVRETLTGA